MRRRALVLLTVLLIGAALALWLHRAPVPSGPPAGDAPADGPAPGAAAAPSVPSGQPVSFLDLTEEEGNVLRFRFLAPQLGQGTLAEEASGDMQALCDGYALAHLPRPDSPPRQVIVSLSEREVPLGEIRPEVVQVFEAYRIEAGKCVWEMF